MTSKKHWREVAPNIFVPPGRTISVSIVPPTHPADVGEDYEP